MQTILGDLESLFIRIAFALVVSLFCFEPAALAQGGKIITIDVPLQEWQKRRAERLQILRPSSFDDAHMKKLDALLTDFEAHPMAQTPLENMDTLGYFYAQREELQKELPLIVVNATLGWYDALRFGSASGQAEISNNEGFFKRVFVMAGQQKIDEYLAFAKEHPDQTRAAIEQGLAFAEKFRDSDVYDRKWPTAYGLERMICAQGGPCSPPLSKPESEWPALWEQTKQLVAKYYSGRQ